MSNEPQTQTPPKREHNATPTYVIGFVLSLVCTLIPYFLVVNHILPGIVLLVTIIGFALMQAVIQVFFFLHLGREKKPYWQSGFLVATVGAIFVVVVGSLWIMDHLHYNMTSVTPTDAAKKLVEGEGIPEISGVKTGACEGKHANHKVTIKNGQVNPYETTAHKCDTLTFINEDDEVRTFSFGTHPNQDVYAGLYNVVVKKGRAKSITLSELGTYTFHDHMNDQTAGEFTVTR